MDRKFQTLMIFVGAALLVSLTACTSGSGGGVSLDTSVRSLGAVAFRGDGYAIRERESSTASALNLNQHKMTETVCDPFGSGTTPALKNGVKADLYWLAAQCPRYSKVQDIIAHGIKSSQTLFFTDLFTPTRPFGNGFSTQTSDVLKDDTGQTLIEWFGLHFSLGLRLPATMPEGNYEVALLSDDGAVMTIRQGNDHSLLIDNDGEHETQMGCSSRYLALSRTAVQKFDLVYYQGPRYHIANVMLWRKAPAGKNAGSDSACGSRGNDLFFDSAHGSTPQKAYSDLLARGWSAVPAAAFVIPDEEGYNPCHVGTAPVVSNFRLFEITLTTAVFAWSTDIPATTQIRYTNIATGEVRVTDSDNRLRTAHTIELTGLSNSSSYSIEVLATSEDNGRAVFGPQVITTQ